jgi:histidine triad (HIT) family protein
VVFDLEKCIFCEIVNGNSEVKKIYEDQYTLALLDISNDVFGHTLVIPKRHVTDLLECDQETLNYTMSTLKKVTNYYVEKCGLSGINILNANKAAAEQSVMHLHFHVIPRNSDDGFTTWPNFTENPRELEEAHQKLTMIKN